MGEIMESYSETLDNLTFNSKPIISQLTGMAYENRTTHAKAIVRIIEDRVKRVPTEQKLPSLYLIDSIVKNHSHPYTALFQPNLTSLFAHVFEMVDVKARAAMYKLRITWKEVFPPPTLFHLDTYIKRELDPKWPVVNPNPNPNVANPQSAGPNIHINPLVFNRRPGTTSSEEVNSKSEKEVVPRWKYEKLQAELEEAKAREKEKKSKTSTVINLSTSAKPSVVAQDSRKSRDPRSLSVKEVMPPDPPKIRDVYKGSASPLKATKVPSKSDSVNSKRNDVDDTVPSKKRRLGKKDQNIRESSPSPSPPPAPTTEKRKYKIPKYSSPPKPSDGFTEIGPHVEFHQGKKLGPKRQRNKTNEGDKNLELFGDSEPAPSRQHPRNYSQPSPTAGWARFKESHPDCYRRPPPQNMYPRMMPNNTRNGFDNSRPRGRMQRPPRNMSHQQIRPSQRGPPRSNPVWENPPSNFVGQVANLQQALEKLQNVDPIMVKKCIIPESISLAQSSFRDGNISQEQLTHLINVARSLDEKCDMLIRNNMNNHPPPFDRNGPAPGSWDHPIRHDMPPQMMPQHPGLSFSTGDSPVQPSFHPNGQHNMIPFKEHLDQPQEKNHSNAANLDKPSPGVVNVHDLWSQLLGAGLINGGQVSSGQTGGGLSDMIPGLETPKSEKPVPNKDDKKEEKDEISTQLSDDKKASEEKPEIPDLDIKPITLKSHHSSLKLRQSAIVDQLYDHAPLQCKNCGLRFKKGDMVLYSHHLDWHFRIRRREKDNAKKAQSQTWYISKDEWIISDKLQNQGKDEKNERETGNVEAEIPTVPMPDSNESETVCPVCKEELEYFFKQDDGRWHFNNAIKPEDDDTIYHPQCYEDHKKSINVSTDEVLMHSNSVMDDSTTLPKAKEETTPMETEDNIDIKLEEGPETVPAEVKEEPMELEPENVEAKTDNDAENNPDPKEQSKEYQPAVSPKSSPKSEEESEMKEELELEGKDKDEEDARKEAIESPQLDDHDSSSNPGISFPAVLIKPEAIRINITSQVDKLERRESAISTQSSEAEESEFDADCIIQDANEDILNSEPELKPKLKGKKLTEFPMQKRDCDTSALCCIM